MRLAMIQARMGSSRLSEKVLMPIAGKPLLWHIYHRLSTCKKIDRVVISTCDNPNCDPIAEFCEKENIGYYRGDETDVLDRLYQTATTFAADTLIRITGDNPLVDPTIVDGVIDYFENNDYDFVSNNHKERQPHGLDVEVFTYAALKDAWESITDPDLRALAIFGLYHNNEKNKVGQVEWDKDYSHIRLTVDYEEDFSLVSAIFSKLGNLCTFDQILDLFTKEPELEHLNDKWKNNSRLMDCKDYLDKTGESHD